MGMGMVLLMVPAAIIAAGLVLQFVGMWIDGAIEPVVAALGMAFAVGLVVLLVFPMPMPLIAFVFLLLSGVGIPWLSQVRQKFQLAKMEREKLDQLVHALDLDPMNGAVRTDLARMLHKRGDIDHAIEHLEWLCREFPGLQARNRPQLDTWKRERERQGAPKTIVCHRCAGENLPGTTRCEHCGAPFGTRTAVLERVQEEGGVARIVRGWVVTAGVVVLSLFALLSLPSIIAGPVILASVIVGAVLFLRWVGGSLGV